MSEPKWTQGPWRVEAWDEASGQARIAQRVRGPGENDWGRSVWMYTGSEADAHLIAASPDLYEALEALERTVNLSVSGIRTVAVPEWAGLLGKAQAALRKARGET